MCARPCCQLTAIEGSLYCEADQPIKVDRVAAFDQWNEAAGRPWKGVQDIETELVRPVLAETRHYLEAQRRELEARLAIDFLSNAERVKLERALVGVIAKLEKR